MTIEHTEQKIKVDLYALTDRQVDILSLARQTGHVSELTLDNLCDGGAQLLRSMGREKYEKMFGKDGFLYSLSAEGKTEMERLLASTDDEIVRMKKELAE